ncbi:MAG: FG-GAP-like repeat-containing protein, partial [Nitrospirota bacterium]|nr:FG-GAP-like repeat-containing protein [Nitrospirota bacterium]
DLLLGGPSGLLFFLGNGDGSFGLSRTILSTASPALSLADFNEDGKIDLIAPEGINLSLFLGEDTPQENIKIEVRDADGLVVGDIAYLDEAGQLVPDAQQTTASGRFLALNVPEGRTLVQVIEGGAGNNMVTTFLDSLSYLHLNMNRIDPGTILLDGQVINPTSGPNAGIAVENIKITPLSTGLETLSLDIFDDPATEDIDEGREGAFKLELGATSEYILKLDPQPF